MQLLKKYKLTASWHSLFFSGKRYVYITGCDSGFGRIAVELFDKENVGVFAGVFLESSIDKLKQEFGGRVIPVPLNVRSEASVLEAARIINEQIKRENAKLIGVVNKWVVLVCLIFEHVF